MFTNIFFSCDAIHYNILKKYLHVVKNANYTMLHQQVDLGNLSLLAELFTPSSSSIMNVTNTRYTVYLYSQPTSKETTA